MVEAFKVLIRRVHDFMRAPFSVSLYWVMALTVISWVLEAIVTFIVAWWRL